MVWISNVYGFGFRWFRVLDFEGLGFWISRVLGFGFHNGNSLLEDLQNGVGFDLDELMFFL